MKRDGKEAGRLMLERARVNECKNPAAFIHEVDVLVQQATEVCCAGLYFPSVIHLLHLSPLLVFAASSFRYPASRD